MDVVVATAFITLLVAGAWSDVRTRRISNDLTIPALLFGLGLRCLVAIRMRDAAPILSGLGGAGLSLAILFPFFAFGAMGGGDVKLSVAAGAFLGVEAAPLALLFTAIAGAVIALVMATRKGVILPVLLGCRELVVYCASFGRAGQRPSLSVPSAVTIPYGLAIAVGSFAGWLL